MTSEEALSIIESYEALVNDAFSILDAAGGVSDKPPSRPLNLLNEPSPVAVRIDAVNGVVTVEWIDWDGASGYVETVDVFPLECLLATGEDRERLIATHRAREEPATVVGYTGT